MANDSAMRKGGYGSVDDIMRRVLRVSDTKGSDEVAKALLKVYPVEGMRLQQEVMGMPIAFESDASPLGAPAVVVGPTEDELAQATDYLDTDIAAVVNEPAFRNFAANLKGFGDSIKIAAESGVSAARAAFDATQRDKVFSVRRVMSDYARLSRRIGLVDQNSRYKCRRLARDIDWIASIMLVLAGDAISKQALKGFLIQISVGELEARHDAIMNALRNLLGTGNAEYDDNTWGRRAIGLQSIRLLINQRGQQDLAILFQEPELSKMLSELIEQIARDNVSGVSAFTPAAQETIEKIESLLLLWNHQMLQPPLVAFLNELRLLMTIVTGRNGRIGMRLIDIARPAVTFSGGIFGNIESNDVMARSRLIQMCFHRSRFINAVDEFNGPDNNVYRLDRLLWYIDRAVDHYALGTDDWGNNELAAVIYAFTMWHYFQNNGVALGVNFPNPVVVNPNWNPLTASGASIYNLLIHDLGAARPAMRQEIIGQNQAGRRYEDLVAAIIPADFM